jgi:hypothetical protein
VAVTSTTRQQWADQVREYCDTSGHVLHYVHVTHPGARGLVIHFSAFFGEWGDARQYRAVFQGHFHRLRMLGDVAEFDWLFVCDEYGADGNGTYYTGEAGDFFVERAVTELIAAVMASSDRSASETVTMGSSMGATAALKFGLRFGVRGIVAISPHVDLDVCAQRQGRWRHVAFICPDGDPVSIQNHRYTRQVRRIIDGWSEPQPPPRLFVQACRDDDGVFGEQVEPLCASWAAAAGSVALDARRSGGHTSEHATRPLLLDAIDRLLDGRPIDVTLYQRERTFRGLSASAGATRKARTMVGRVLRALRLRRRPDTGTGHADRHG